MRSAHFQAPESQRLVGGPAGSHEGSDHGRGPRETAERECQRAARGVALVRAPPVASAASDLGGADGAQRRPGEGIDLPLSNDIDLPLFEGRGRKRSGAREAAKVAEPAATVAARRGLRPIPRERGSPLRAMPALAVFAAEVVAGAAAGAASFATRSVPPKHPDEQTPRGLTPSAGRRRRSCRRSPDAQPTRASSYWPGAAARPRPKDRRCQG